MKKYVIISLIMIASMLTGLMGVAPRTANAQAGLISSMLNRMEANRRNMRSLRSRITMVKYNSQIGDEDKYEGMLLYVPGAGRNANVRLEWERPQREVLAVSNGQYNLFRPRMNIVYVGRAGAGKGKVSGLFEYMTMSSQQIRARFEPVQYMGEETLWGGVSTTHVKLVPKSNAGFDSKYAEVWVDGSGMPVQIKVVERNDDATTVRLTNLEKNASISPDEFHLVLDRSVKRIQS